MKLIILLISLAAICCSDDFQIAFRNGRIVGGQFVQISQIGWQVSIQREGQHRCGASILNNNWIVTAAHCCTEKNVNYTVRVGSSYQNRNGTVHKVSKIILHPKYDDAAAIDLDVALIQVQKPFRINGRTVREVKLVDANEDTPAGDLVMVSGWGSLGEDKPSSEQLQAALIPVVDWNTCKRNYAKESFEITENMMCVGYEQGGTDACSNDNGGPIVNEDLKLVGIVSWGLGCARPNTPGVYTRIASESVRNFIRQHARL